MHPTESSLARPARGGGRTLLVLAVAAAALFTAGMSRLSLPSLDDCFYARKGVEMGRARGTFDVTWNGNPNFQNPPLQFWILGRSFALLGENDVAARMPSVLMGLGLVLATARLGWLCLGPPAALAGVALLLLSPLFLNNARRCMLEIPLAFWITLGMLVFVEGLRRPRLHIGLALPLAAGVLTKSVLGLMPCAIFLFLAVGRDRGFLRSGWLWSGIGLGVLMGASWSVHLWLAHGGEALRAHYLGEVAARSARPLRLWEVLGENPRILLQFYQPVLLPGVAGMVLLWRDAVRRRAPLGLLLPAWILLPVVLYSFSSARSARYLFPILPPLALCGGWWLVRAVPRTASLLARAVVPSALLAGAAILWLRPSWLERDENAAFKRGAATLQAAQPAGDPIPYLGDRYWSYANPLLFYGERSLERTGDTVEVVGKAAARPSRLLLCDRDRLSELQARGIETAAILDGNDWSLVQLAPRR